MKQDETLLSITIGVPVEPALRDEIDALADSDHRSRAQMARVLIREALDARKAAQKPTTGEDGK